MTTEEYKNIEKKALDYIDQGNYVGAMPYLKELSDNGHQYAKYHLARCYYNIEGIASDYNKAFKLMKSIADSNIYDSTKYLALFYYKGIGTAKNDEEAFRWFHISADSGDAESMFYLGRLYYYGEGTPLNLYLSKGWFSASNLNQSQEWISHIDCEIKDYESQQDSTHPGDKAITSIDELQKTACTEGVYYIEDSFLFAESVVIAIYKTRQDIFRRFLGNGEKILKGQFTLPIDSQKRTFKITPTDVNIMSSIAQIMSDTQYKLEIIKDKYIRISRM